MLEINDAFTAPRDMQISITIKNGQKSPRKCLSCGCSFLATWFIEAAGALRDVCPWPPRLESCEGMLSSDKVAQYQLVILLNLFSSLLFPAWMPPFRVYLARGRRFRAEYLETGTHLSAKKLGYCIYFLQSLDISSSFLKSSFRRKQLSDWFKTDTEILPVCHCNLEYNRS